MIGELEYADLFHEADIHYESLTYGVFVIFLCLVTIIIMNLLVRHATLILICIRKDEIVCI